MTQTSEASQSLALTLARNLARRYHADQYPALLAQAELWARHQPLAGISVLDATPVFTNTTAKHVALLAGGAKLTVSTPPGLPADPDVAATLAALGVPVIAGPDDPRAGSYDVILDCAGLHSQLPSRYGYAELTRSGITAYRSCHQPVVSIDDSPIKLVETALGTGESFLRAASALGHPMPLGATVVLFGAGKVGRGVVAAVTRAGGQVIVVDEPDTPVPGGIRRISLHHHGEVAAALARCWCVVTATGVPGAAATFAAELMAGDALLANMGVADEFGPAVPPERVLNAKAPVNFVLAEPTLMQYMDPVMALHNAAAPALLAGGLGPGIQRPDAATEDEIMAEVLARGVLAGELAGWWPPTRKGHAGQPG